MIRQDVRRVQTAVTLVLWRRSQGEVVTDELRPDDEQVRDEGLVVRLGHEPGDDVLRRRQRLAAQARPRTPSCE